MKHYAEGKVLRFQDEAGTVVKILSVISSGTQGVVYKAYDQTRRKQVALKLLLPGYCQGSDSSPEALREAQKIFHRKCKALAKKKDLPAELVLPEAVSPLMDNGCFFYTMPLLEEGYKPVAYAITKKHWDKLTYKQRLELCLAFAEVLNKLHRKHLIFCDISETNLQFKLDSHGKIHVRFIDCENITRRGRTMGLQGTGLYRAPELLTPDPNDPDDRLGVPTEMSDILDFSILSFRILCQGHPLGGTEVRKMILTPEMVQSCYGENPKFIFDRNHITATANTIQQWNQLDRELKMYYTYMFSPESLHLTTPRLHLDIFIDIIKNIL